MLEPTPEQRQMLEEVNGAVALAQFLAFREQAAFNRYRRESETVVRHKGGRRAYGVHIDQILAGGEMPFQELMVDVFPSAKATLAAFDALQEARTAAIAEAYALAVSPAGGPARMVRRLRFLSPLLRLILGTSSEKVRPELEGELDPNTGPVPETIEVLRKHDQTTPLSQPLLHHGAV